MLLVIMKQKSLLLFVSMMVSLGPMSPAMSLRTLSGPKDLPDTVREGLFNLAINGHLGPPVAIRTADCKLIDLATLAH